MGKNEILESILDATRERWRDQIDLAMTDAILGPHSTVAVKVSMAGERVEVRHIPYSQMVDVTSP